MLEAAWSASQSAAPWICATDPAALVAAACGGSQLTCVAPQQLPTSLSIVVYDQANRLSQRCTQLLDQVLADPHGRREWSIQFAQLQVRAGVQPMSDQVTGVVLATLDLAGMGLRDVGLRFQTPAIRQVADQVRLFASILSTPALPQFIR